MRPARPIVGHGLGVANRTDPAEEVVPGTVWLKALSSSGESGRLQQRVGALQGRTHRAFGEMLADRFEQGISLQATAL
jgi:hypothetical protein